jgi:ABC-2 type transport system permease protein
MRPAVRAEWTKLRTVVGTSWLVLGTIVVTVTLSAFVVTAESSANTGAGVDLTKLSLTGIYLGQAVVAVLGVVAIGSEYGFGVMRSTLAAMPRRSTVLAAKAVVVGGLVLATGTFAVGACLLAGRLILPRHGFTAAHGYALLSFASGPTLRAAAGSVLYLALVALLSLGVAASVRSSAAGIGIVLGLLYLFPIVAAVIPGAHWQRHLHQIGPMTAGLAIQATTNLRSLPIGPWAGLGVLAAGQRER